MDLASAPPVEASSARPQAKSAPCVQKDANKPFSDSTYVLCQGPRTGRRAASNLVPAVSDVEVVNKESSPVVPAGPRPQVCFDLLGPNAHSSLIKQLRSVSQHSDLTGSTRC